MMIWWLLFIQFINSIVHYIIYVFWYRCIFLLSDRLLHKLPFHIFDDYLIFNISFAADHFNNSVYIDRDIFINETSVRITNASEPLVVIYKDQTLNPLLEKPDRVKRDEHLNNMWGPQDSSDEPDAFFACKRQPWKVVFELLNWTGFLFPKEIDAGMCKGECDFPLVEQLNSTNYSFLKNVWHEMTGNSSNQVPKACCVPISFAFQTIAFFGNSGSIVLRQMPDMRVQYCGCRWKQAIQSIRWKMAMS